MQTTPTQAPPPPVLDNISVAPSARKLANDNSVNLQLVKGTGKDGTIMKEDVLSFMEAVPKATEKAEVTVDTVQRSGKVLATPAVRHMAKEEGVNLSEVQGSGENGRVLEEDLQRHIGLQKGEDFRTPSAPSQYKSYEELCYRCSPATYCAH